jgi:hypothetical protein
MGGHGGGAAVLTEGRADGQAEPAFSSGRTRTTPDKANGSRAGDADP